MKISTQSSPLLPSIELKHFKTFARVGQNLENSQEGTLFFVGEGYISLGGWVEFPVKVEKPLAGKVAKMEDLNYQFLENKTEALTLNLTESVKNNIRLTLLKALVNSEMKLFKETLAHHHSFLLKLSQPSAPLGENPGPLKIVFQQN